MKTAEKGLVPRVEYQCKTTRNIRGTEVDKEELILIRYYPKPSNFTLFIEKELSKTAELLKRRFLKKFMIYFSFYLKILHTYNINGRPL